MDYLGILLISIKIICSVIIIIDITEAPQTMWDKLQRMIFGEVTTKPLPYLFICSTCASFWSVLSVLLISSGVPFINSLFIASISAYIVPFIRELLLLIQEKVVGWLGKI